MDTVSMLNKMRFYCQPILPLVYDESMSYYETLCKVVGQLNTTGDAVNKLNEGLTGEIADRQKADSLLNEGLTGEIADRQKADSLLNERLKVLEDTNKKIHFLAFAGTPPHSAGLIGTAPTRSELRQWVNNHDLIITLLETTDEERNLVYAASCAYNAGNWSDESSDDFNVIVPISTSYDSEGDYAVRQKIAKITIPPASASSLDEEWGLQVIEINTPSTSANGVVNFAANIFEDGHMECNLTPFEFMNLYAPTWANRNLCVAVNAKLFYDGYTRTSSIATLNSTNHLIRIAFERDYGTFINNGVKQLNKTLDYIIGDVSTNVWTHETIDSKTLDFSRYEGFQFTRGAGNAITANDESTPNAVYAQYHSDTSGKIYQNLPVRLVDTVDNAEYWNGVFDIKDNTHMTFTFVTSNYVTASGKMLVRVIELSADANTTVWKYAEKEFELPITGSFTVDDALSDTSTNPVQNKVVKEALDSKLSTLGGEISGHLAVGLTVGAGGSVSTGVTKSDSGIHFEKAASDAGRISHGMADVDGTVPLARLKVASPTENDDAATKAYVDNNAAGAGAVRYDAAQTLEAAQQGQARTNIGAVGHNSPQFQGYVTLTPANAPIGTGVGLSPTGSGNNFVLNISDVNEDTPTLLTGVRTPTDTDANAAATVEYVKAKVASGSVPKPLTYDYMPEGYPSKSVVTVTLMAEQEVTFTNSDGMYQATAPVKIDVSEGQTYTVVWDGVEYSCVCHTMGPYEYIGNPKVFGKESTGEPFFYVDSDQPTFVSYDTSTSHTIKVTTIDTVYQTIDVNMLPKAGENYGVVKKDEIVTAYSFPMSAPHDQMVDAIAAFETGNASIVWDGVKVNDAHYDSSDDTVTVVYAYEPLGNVKYANVDGFYIKTLGTTTYRELQGSKVRIVNDDNVYAVLSVSGKSSNETLEVLAERIHIGGASYGISKTEIILKSSTSGSTKNFKITVDDSGTISATELT